MEIIVRKIPRKPRLAIEIMLRRTIDALSPLMRGRVKTGICDREKFPTVDLLVEKHFINSATHPCRNTLYMALTYYHNTPLAIVETGSSAKGANSTMLFDSYVNTFGGTLDSVDLRASPMFLLEKKCTSNTRLHCNDSVDFLACKKFDKNQNSLKKLIYLDSWDVDWNNPLPSMIHGLNEFLTIMPSLSHGDLVLIDDTPKDVDVLERVQGSERADNYTQWKNNGIRGGKGSLIKDYVCFHKICQVIEHDYQLLLKVI